MSQQPIPFPANEAAVRPISVRLKVRDLGRVRDFYERFLGLQVTDEGPRHADLGNRGSTLLHLETEPGLVASGPAAAGLFHTAFLLPDSATLGAWLIHAAQSGAPIVGASDHIVSEAIYLTDPEGNGVEVYADRAPDRWRGPDGAIRMSTGPLDLNKLASGATDPWTGFPNSGTLGHVHLQAGNLAEADAFWKDVMGFEITTHYPGASFYATGGYHHHIAANIWNSRGAPARTRSLSGLSEIRLHLRDPAHLDRIAEKAQIAGRFVNYESGILRLQDPWNIELQLEGNAPHAD